MNKDLDKIKKDLSGKWRNRDLSTLVNDVTRMQLDRPGDWDPPAGITAKRQLIDMTIGIPDAASLPKSALLESAKRVLDHPGDGAYTYGFGMGYTRLRAQLADRYTRHKGLEVDDGWFQLTNGSSGAIDLICRTLLSPGDVIISESPTYMGTLRNFRGVLADIHSVPVDKDGLIIEALDKKICHLKEVGKAIKFIYTISTFQNPTGACLSLERRIELLRLAAEHDILILDDDAYGDLYFEKKPPTALSTLSGGYGVITVGTLSKVLATGLRIGWIHAEPKLAEIMGKMRFAMGLNQISVRLISDYMSDGSLDRHIDAVRNIYTNKMHILCDRLSVLASEHLSFDAPDGGFYLWLKLREGLSAENVWRTAAEEGVSLTRGTSFFTNKDPDAGYLRIAFPWTPLDQLEEGARRLSIACERVALGKGA
jgi:2-aminoadipate transaminase